MRLIRETPWYGWLLIVLSIAAGILIVGILFFGSNRVDENAQAIAEADKTRIALCALRLDLDARIAVSQKLLDDNPGKERIAGFDRALIEMTLANARRTRQALDILDCKEAR